MGNSHSQQHFVQSNWRQISSSFSEVVQYQSIHDKNTHIEKYQIRSVSKEEFDKVKEISSFRRNNPHWVSSLYFQQKEIQDSEFCSYQYEGQLYLQKIPIRLCDLRNIPFPDALHLYSQTLLGFSQLAKYLGCFPIESDYIGINERGVVKVWAGAKWSQVTVRGGMISQEDMVRTLVQCLQEAIDKNSMPPQNPSIRNFLYRTSDRINFLQSINELRAFASMTNMGNIPSRLISIEDNPDRYDTERLRTQQKNFPTQQHIHFINPQSLTHFPPQSLTQFSNHYSPRFSVRPKSIPEHITTFKRVESVQNEAINKQAPVSQFARQGRAVSNYQQGVVYPQNNYVMNPNSSLRRLPSAHSTTNLRNHQIVYQRVMIEPTQQNINFRPPPANESLNPPNIMDRNRAFSHRRQQNPRPLPIINQQSISAYQPSQQSRNQFVQQYQQVPLRPPFIPTNVQVDQNKPPSQSIIMKLNSSQDYPVKNPNISFGQAKQFTNIKRAESLHVDIPKKFDSSTIINENQPDSMIGIPTGELEKRQLFIANKYEPLNLNSIQQVHTEHFWKDSAPSNPAIIPANPQPFSLSHIKEHKSKPSQMVFKNDFKVIDQNDGKSSDEFLNRLKQLSTGTSTHFQSNSNNFDYNYGSDKKRSVKFVDEPKKEEIFGRSAQSKQQSYLNDYYDSNLFAAKAYGGQIDPDIWADMQKYQK